MKVQLSIDELLQRIAANDREAAVELLFRFGARLRRRIRGKLGASMRRIIDSQDIMATVARQFDRLVMSGHLQVENEAKLWSLLNLLADHAVVDKARHLRRAQRAEAVYLTASRARDYARKASTFIDPKLNVQFCLRSLSKPQDQRILSSWLKSEGLDEAAAAVCVPIDAARRRWKAIRKLLRHTIEARDMNRETFFRDPRGS